MQNLITKLSAIVGRKNILSEPDELLVYECDGLPQHKHRPLAVVFPSNTEETAAVMRALSAANVAYTPRGAGTGLSGGALALEGVVIELARMRKILRIDPINRLAVVQPGVINLQVSKAVASHDLYYVPDPSSQPTCTIGGNIAEGAGGVHCLKYGTTTDHVLGCRVVLANGDVVELGSQGIETLGYDLVGTFVGSEGTFGIVTEATLKLAEVPPAVRTLLAEFLDVNDASHAVSTIIAEGVMPAALEMMDHEIIRAVEASVFAAGLPTDIGAALLIELDGIEAGLDDEADRVTDICLRNGARACRRARDEAERKKLWAARKGAFGAIGRISPDSMIQDAVVPRSRLPEVLGAAYQIATKYQLKLANVFHAGDGNLHPLICFDSRYPEQVKSVKEAGRELMQVCVAAGGTITGEHGVGLDKRELLPLVFSETDMQVMLSVRAAFDPTGLLNPGKIIPVLRGCGEARAISNDTQPGRQDTAGFGPLTFPDEVVPTRKQKIVAEHLSVDIDDAAIKLGHIVGAENVAVSDSVTVFPESTTEVSEILKLASCELWRVLPAGAMTFINRRNSSIVISTRRLNRLLEHEPADLITIAQAGISLKELNETLKQKGQWVPLDPPDDGSATIGGVVATGLGGAHQFAYGRPRGSVIGMKVVLADGRIVKMGGRVVKNVAGYDLSKLFTGSFGSLGIITEVNLKLRPRPQRELTVVASGSMETLLQCARELTEAHLFPVATELISPTVAGNLAVAEDLSLLMRFAGIHQSVEFQIDKARQIISDNKLPHNLINDDSQLWQDVATLPVNVALSVRVSVSPSQVKAAVSGLLNFPNSTLWQAGILDGRLRVMSKAGDDTRALRTSLKHWGEWIKANNGIIVFEKGLEDREKEMSLVDRNQTLGKLILRIKNQLDPLGLLPPPPQLSA